MKIKKITILACILLSQINIYTILAQKKNDKIIFNSCDTVKLIGEISFADTFYKNTIVINVMPCLNTKLTSNIDKDDTKANFFEKLKEKIISKGMIYFEFAGRADYKAINDIKVQSSTMFTKEQDLSAAISYIESRNDLKNKKIVLMGGSEGGSVCAIHASKNPKISSIILFAAPCVSGRETIEYQMRYADTLAMNTYFRLFKDFDLYCNNVSSLKSKNYEHSIAGFKLFREDTCEPLENIVHYYNDYDTIAMHVIDFLKKKWEREDDKTRNNNINRGDFKNYCQAHMYLEYIRPQSIDLRKWNPDVYYPLIKCPVLTVNGTKDKRVECYSTIENMKKLLKSGCNNKLTIYLLEGYNHSMDTSQKNTLTKDIVIENIIEWILKNTNN